MRKRIWRCKSFRHQGQASTEYILLLAVIVILVVSVGRRLRENLLGFTDCPNPSYICQLQEKVLGRDFLEGRFTWFTLRR